VTPRVGWVRLATGAAAALAVLAAVAAGRDGGWRRLRPATSPRLDSLPLVATEIGRRTLVVDGRRLPLFSAGAGPARLVLTVRR